MNATQIILPIIVGGCIGYCTNYIAIKMLFRPRKTIYLGKWRLPFTPGVIPKNQKRIAKAIANAVSEQLLTKEDIFGKLKRSDVREAFVKSATQLIAESKLTDTVADEVIERLEETDFSPAIREIGTQALRDYLENPMIAMFLNESMLEMIYTKVNIEIQNYIHNNGKEAAASFVQSDEKMTVRLLESSFDSLLPTLGRGVLETLDINAIVAEKIEQMDVAELEELVLSVMKEELQAIVNLGALIGAVIGIVNIFI